MLVVAADVYSLAAVVCMRAARRPFASAVLRNAVDDGCKRSAVGCIGAADGCSLAADVFEDAAALRVETSALRHCVHRRPLFASVGGDLSANGCKFTHDD